MFIQQKYIFEFTNFPHDDRIWRLDWFIDIKRNIHTPSEPKIGILLTSSNEDTISNNRSHQYNHSNRITRKIIYVNVGYLPYLQIGTFFKNGHKIYVNNEQKYTKCRISVYLKKNYNTHILPADYKLTNNHYLIPPNYYYLGKYGLATKIYVIDTDEQNKHIIIPTIEIARHFYFNSSNLIRALLWGQFHGVDGIFNPDKTYIDDKGRGYLHLRDKMLDDDAWVISQFAFNNEAFIRASLIHNSLLLSSINNQLAIMETFPPFDGHYQLTLHGMWIMSGGVRRFLTFYIERSNYPFPTDDLTISRDNDNRSDGIFDLNRPIAYASLPYKILKLSKQPSRISLISDHEPSKYLQPFKVLLHNERFEWLKGKKYKKLPKEECHYRAENSDIVLGDSNNNYSTGDGLYHQEDTTQINISGNTENKETEKKPRKKALSPDFNHLYMVMEALKFHGLNFITIKPPELMDEDNEHIVFPNFDGRRYINWSITTEGNTRRILILQIVFNGTFFYLFEAEAIGKQDPTTLLLNTKELTQLPINFFTNFLHDAAKVKCVWKHIQLIHNLQFRAFKHTWPDPNYFANKLLDTIHKRYKSVASNHIINNVKKII